MEDGNYNPGVWKGHDFKAARAAYDSHIDTSFTKAKSSGKTITDLVEKSLRTLSKRPLSIVCDVTGSMNDWPAVMFSKLGYLEIEAKEYLGDDLEICFAAVGDAYCDRYPLQVRPFDKGTNLIERLKELVNEQGGGGQATETYELGALYFARNVEMPNAVLPILIFIGDEAPYSMVDKEHASRFAGIALEKSLPTEQVFRELKERYSVYLVRKPYGDSDVNSMDSLNKNILTDWINLLGEDHIVTLPAADRVVDVIFGILGRETGKEDYFLEEITGRQTKAQVDTVMRALRTIHRLPAPSGSSGHSIMRGGDDGKPSKPLI